MGSVDCFSKGLNGEKKKPFLSQEKSKNLKLLAPAANVKHYTDYSFRRFSLQGRSILNVSQLSVFLRRIRKEMYLLILQKGVVSF